MQLIDFFFFKLISVECTIYYIDISHFNLNCYINEMYSKIFNTFYLFENSNLNEVISLN